LDSGIFIHQIRLAKVNSSAITSYVVSGIRENFIPVSMVSGALIGITTTTTTIGIHFGGYLHVRAGPGKLVGTGDGVSTGTQAALLCHSDSEQRRR